ncbi:unnamed protein product, partial [Polarella glacialis]
VLRQEAVSNSNSTGAAKDETIGSGTVTSVSSSTKLRPAEDDELRRTVELRCFLRRVGLEDILTVIRESSAQGSLRGLLDMSEGQVLLLKTPPARLQRLSRALAVERQRQEGLGM